MNSFQKAILRHVLGNRDGYRCFWCDRPLLRRTRRKPRPPLPADYPTIDHVFPSWERWRCPAETSAALVLSCPGCNARRGDMNFVEFGIRTIAERVHREFLARGQQS